MKIVCVIPARLGSSRFPKKVLSMLGEKPLLQWIWEGAQSTGLFEEIVFAIDAIETGRLIDSFQGKYYMTSPDCLSGTDRLIELQAKGDLSGDIWVNWQGDEPFIRSEMIETLLQSVDQNFDVWSLRKKVERQEEIADLNVVKVVTGPQGRALYFSRAPIPHNRAEQKEVTYYKHIGIYAYTKEALQKIAALPSSSLEVAEGLEQLRFLENGLTIQVHTTEHDTFGIDVPSDLAQAIDRISSHIV